MTQNSLQIFQNGRFKTVRINTSLKSQQTFPNISFFNTNRKLEKGLAVTHQLH